MLHREEGAFEIDINHLVPARLIDPMHRPATCHTGCGHDTIDATVFCDHRTDQFRRGRLVANVEFTERRRFATWRDNNLTPWRCDITADYLRTFRHEPFHARRSDP